MPRQFTARAEELVDIKCFEDGVLFTADVADPSFVAAGL